MNNQVFRKVAIERLSSPEQLDNLVRVTSPRAWLALCGIGLLLAAVVYWGLFGTLSNKISAQGVLIHPGGLKTVHASFDGTVSDIRVKLNDTVTKGDTIAWLEQIKELRRALSQLDSGERTPESAAMRASYEQRLQALLAEYEYAAKVTSPYTGKVVEIMAAKGQYVGSGSSIIRLETHDEGNDELTAVLYVPVQLGKQLRPGMDVRLTPASVNREEYGSLIGSIVSISEFPVTVQGMMTTLGNEGLVQQMASQGVSLEVRVSLVPDATTESGYRWSTEHGPPIQLSSGTIVYSAITTQTMRPIGMVIPQLQ